MENSGIVHIVGGWRGPEAKPLLYRGSLFWFLESQVEGAPSMTSVFLIGHMGCHHSATFF